MIGQIFDRKLNGLFNDEFFNSKTLFLDLLLLCKFCPVNKKYLTKWLYQHLTNSIMPLVGRERLSLRNKLHYSSSLPRKRDPPFFFLNCMRFQWCCYVIKIFVVR
jgi:hypothetical protein